MKSILHLCNDFLGSKVYFELYSRLENYNHDQIIFCPIRSTNISKIDRGDNSPFTVLFSDKLHWYHKILFKHKINFLLSSLESHISDFSNISISIATTLFSDGSLAYELFKRYNIPYIVTVRAGDVELFLRYRKDLLSYIYEVLANSSKVIFISDSLKLKFFHYSRFSEFRSKSIVIYNGINSFWIDNISTNKSVRSNFLFVGRLIKEKNLKVILEAFIHCISNYPNLRLTIVGDGPLKDMVVSYRDRFPSNILYVGSVEDKVVLKRYYSENRVFLMPSLIETFGLTYIEALSQGEYLIYSKGTGIDGIFDKHFGVSVNSSLKYSIVKAIEYTQINQIDFNPMQLNWNLFDWNSISMLYNNIINEIRRT